MEWIIIADNSCWVFTGVYEADLRQSQRRVVGRACCPKGSVAGSLVLVGILILTDFLGKETGPNLSLL